METKKLGQVVVCVVALAASIVVIARTCYHPGARYDPAFDECLGAKVAEETIKLMDNNGTIVLLDAMADNRLLDARRRGFHRVIDQHPGLKILGTESPVGINETPRFDGLAAPFLERVLAKYPGVNALVSFIGVPDVRPVASSFDPAKLPKTVVVLCLGPLEHWQELLSAHSGAAVIRSRTQSDREISIPSANCDDYVAATSAPPP